MKHFKRILSLLLAVMMTLSMAAVVGAANVSFTDVSGHWAWTGGQIPYLVSKNVLNGYKQSDGTYTFQPDGQVTRAEFVKMLDETFGLKATAAVPFTDVASTDWFAPYFGKAAAQGYLLNYGKTVSPNGKLTREEAISLLVRYIGLSADKQESPSYFSDYASISENYRNYIMEAVYAGLTDGYTDSGARTFQPKRVLTRAEALTILYRAAGAIFTGTTSKRDTGAAGENNTFVTAGSTVISDLNFYGRNIVSEGADAGALTFMNCKFIGPLTIRGGGDVIFYNCTATDVTVKGGGNFSLLDRSSVSNLTVEKAAELGVNSNTSVANLTVSSTGLTIRGDGAIGDASILAGGVVSSITPATFTVAPGLSAVFAGNAVTGSSSDLISFETEPFVFSDGLNSYLAVNPSVSGTVYAYYTNSEVLPSVSDFDAEYEMATYTVRLNADSGAWNYASTQTMATVGGYRYMVLQLQQESRRYRPVLVRCSYPDGNGMSSIPTLTGTSMSVKAAQTGTLLWYYTDNGSKLTAGEFMNGYLKAGANLRGTGSVNGTFAFTIALDNARMTSYGYVALMIRNSENGYYAPVTVSVGYNGFTSGPEVKTAGTIRYTARESGTLYYYFTDTGNSPATEKFQSEYNAARNQGTTDVRANIESEFKFDTATASRYPYMVLALKNSSGTWLQPVVLEVSVDTGFDTDPAIRSEGEIRFYTREGGTVKYYYTSSASAPTVEEFNKNYTSSPSQYRDSMRVSRSTAYVINYYVQYASTRPYMAIMYTDGDNKDYSPVLVELQNTTGTGFLINPYVDGNEIRFTTKKDGQVLLFYTTSSSPMAADDFYAEYSSSYTYRDSVTVRANVSASITIDAAALRLNRYAVLAFLPEGSQANSRDYSYPYILDVKAAQEEIRETGLNAAYDKDAKVILLTSQYTGTVYYYYTNYESDLPLENSSFDSNYRSASGATNVSVRAGTPKAFEPGEYRYAVFCLRYENKYYLPCIIDTGTGREYSNGINDGSTMNRTGLLSVQVNSNMTEVTFIPEVSGSVALLIVQDGFISNTYNTVTVKTGEPATIKIPNLDFLAFLLSGGTYYLQLTSGGEVYQAYKLFTVN
jgi:hypothetical protein